MKKNVFENLGLPLRLKFGKVRKLHLKVPWARLSSAPVELILETLMLIVVPEERSNWKVKDTQSFEFKRKALEEFTQIMAANLKLALTS